MFRLEKIQIAGYKNLTGDYDFSNNKGYIALIGLNGSGKSNLLEAISIIFDGLINNKGTGIPFEYEIEYSINDHRYTRKKRQATKDGIICKAEELEYPSSLIACYSGEDLRLWQIAYEKYHMGYFNEAVKQTYSSPTFLYINKYCWKIALISLLCSNNDKVKDFLKYTLKIDSPSDVELDLSYDDTKKDGFQAHAALNWFDRIVQDGNQNINLNIIATTDIYIAGRQVSEEHKAKYVFNFLYLLSQPKKNEKNKIDKLIDNINIIVNKDDYKINFDDLSEGEKKLILIECITKVLGEENSLALLDEPDAHTHIAMKKHLLKLISEFDGQTIMTTHSPIFVDMMQFNNLLYLTDGKPAEMNRIEAIKVISDGQISVLESALISSYRKIIVTEGPGDVTHLVKAIDLLAGKYPTYNPLANEVAIVFQGGAKMVKDYYHSVLENLLDNLDKVTFVFDHDSEGREGAKMVEQLAIDKIDYLFYEKNYPISNAEVDFYLEDFYPDSFYSEVKLPQIEGKPQYRQMMKMSSLAGSVKKKISKLLNTEGLDVQYFEGFMEFLNQLLKKFNFPNE